MSSAAKAVEAVHGPKGEGLDKSFASVSVILPLVYHRLQSAKLTR